jgi:uncharacterized protein YjaG (DUF416 family)
MTRQRKHPHADTEQFESVLLELSPSHRIAFCAAIAERLYPNFVAFHEESGWGEPSVLRAGLDAAWVIACDEEAADAERLSELRMECLEQAPPTGHFESDLESAALDAATAAAETVACCMDASVVHCSDIATFAADTVDMYLQISGAVQGGAALEAQIAAHPLMQRELERQRADLALLRAAPRVDAVLREVLQSGSLGLRP